MPRAAGPPHNRGAPPGTVNPAVVDHAPGDYRGAILGRYSSALLLSFHPALARPMYALAIIRYRRPLDEVVTVTDEHRAYLRGLHEAGILLASGPVDPRSGGILLLRVPDDDAQASLDRIRDGDPYHKRGMAQYELLPWLPTIGVEALEAM